MNRLDGAALMALVMLFPGTSPAALEDLEIRLVIDHLSAPVQMIPLDQHRTLVVSLGGRVWILNDGKLHRELFLPLSSRLASAGYGLWSIALHPRFVDNGLVFAHFVERETWDSIVARYQRTADGASQIDAASEQVLLRIPKPERLHYGGHLEFGPDGYLYVTTGDSSDWDNVPDRRCVAQSSDSLEGKILRLDVDQTPLYGIPPNNPYVGSGRGEVWAIGLRNPWRLSFDRETGDLWISDVGHDRLEELNFVPRAAIDQPLATNFGWKVREGSHCHDDRYGCTGSVPKCGDPSLVLPTLQYRSRDPECAVIGGTVYRGRLVPALYGRYIYADFCVGRIWAASREVGPGSGEWTSNELPARLPGINSFGSDAQGELYLLAGDAVYQLIDTTLPAAGLIELDDTALTVAEDVGVALIGVSRLGGSLGQVSVEVATLAGSATAGADYDALKTVLTWSDGEIGRKELAVSILDDALDEADETFELQVAAPSNGAVLGVRTRALVRVRDDEVCRPSATTLCLVGGRFAVSLDWRSAESEGRAQVVPSGPNAGSFWFFERDNPEVYVKVLDACIEPFRHFWVFAAGLTNVETRLMVIDTYTDQVQRYDQPLGPAFVAVQDTQTFAACDSTPP